MAFILRKKMFTYRLANHYQTILNNKFNSAHSYGEYVRFLADTGNLDTLIETLKSTLMREPLFGNSHETVDVTVRLIHFYKKHAEKTILFHQVKTVNDLQVYLVHHQFSVEIYQKFMSEILPTLDVSKISHEQNMICGYIANLALKQKCITALDCEKLVNFFVACKNSNKHRTDHCLISIMLYAIKHNYSSFFKFVDRYNHFQRIVYAIQSSKLIDDNEKQRLQQHFFSAIREVNHFQTNKKKKFAVCISGMFRGHFNALQDIAEKIVKPLDADVFIHTWDEQADWPGIGGTASFFRLFGQENEKKIPVEYRGVNGIFKIEEKFPALFQLIKQPIVNCIEKEKIQAYFPNAVITVDNQAQFEQNIISNINKATTVRYKNQLKMFYGIKQSFQMALEAENNYDFIIRIRPDVAVADVQYELIRQAKDDIFYGLTEHFVGPTDVEFLCSSKMAYSFLKFTQNIFELGRLNPYTELPDTDAHRLMLLWLIENNFTLGQDLIKTFILDSQHFKKFPNLKEILEQDIQHLDQNDIEKNKGLIDFFQHIAS